MYRIAIIDLGTNSVRFDIYDVYSRNKTRLLHREKSMVRLGQGVFRSGHLHPAAIKRALRSLQNFRRTIDQLRIQKVLAFGTSALRESGDGARFIRTAWKTTGIKIRVISGSEEAKLIARGVIEGDPTLVKKTKGRTFALVDIGGGSTEISVCRGKRCLSSHSFPLGAARLQQTFLRAIPPSPSNLLKLRREIQAKLAPYLSDHDWPFVETIVGSSGTVKAVVRIAQKQRRGFPRIGVRDLAKLVQKLSPLNRADLHRIKKLEPKRVELILAGAVLLEEIAKAFCADRIVSTELALRDGILASALSKNG